MIQMIIPIECKRELKIERHALDFSVTVRYWGYLPFANVCFGLTKVSQYALLGCVGVVTY